jgi:hypothetical protein
MLDRFGSIERAIAAGVGRALVQQLRAYVRRVNLTGGEV